MAVVYRHVRHDTNEPFYVGIGLKEKRAYEKRDRSILWENIVKQTTYSVHILFNDINEEVAIEKEKEFIALYKRIKEGGTLINRTCGGAAFIKHTEESKKKMAANKGKKLTAEQRQIISGYTKNRTVSLITRAKQSASQIGKGVGKKASQATKEKMSMSAAKGEKNSQTKLNKESVIKIREMYAKGNTSHYKLAILFNVSKGTIKSLINRKTWKHL